MTPLSTPPTPLVLDAEQAAAALCVPVDTVKNLRRTGQLHSLKVGKHVRFCVDDLQEFVNKARKGERN